MYKSEENPVFRSALADTIFREKRYKHPGAETWDILCRTLVEDVVKERLSKNDKDQLVKYMQEQKFVPGGRYLYYAGRERKFFNNCFLLKSEEDTREDWAELSKKAELCLTCGGGIGNDYSVYRERGAPLKRTGGEASGPVSKMRMINEIGRHVIQGGTRRSAIYASLNWKHSDIPEFLTVKDWTRYPIAGTEKTLSDVKREDFNFPAPLDMTNISVNYDTEWLYRFYNTREVGGVFFDNVAAALRTGEPGFSFNFDVQEKETLRNACTEVISEDDSDVCNLGSVNLSRIETIEELEAVTALGTVFLLCGTLVADLPYPKVATIRNKNRRLGLGLMGLHEWLLQRGYPYAPVPELHRWLAKWKEVSDLTSKVYAYNIGISIPIANRAIAPTGTIAILAGTTTGIEPIFAVAYRRRYLTKGSRWKYQFAIDKIAQDMIDRYSIDPEKIECSFDLAKRPKARIAFQAAVQKYVDMGISSTLNLPAWGSEYNNPDTVADFARLLAGYAPELRGFTVYPDGARGGQPLVPVSYKEAITKLGEEFTEYNDICDVTGKGGFCGS